MEGGKRVDGAEGTGGSPSDAGVSTKPGTCPNSVLPRAAPAAHWVNATGNLAGVPAGCENVGGLSADPCSGRVIAGVEGHGLWATDDSGMNWRALGTGAASAAITNTGHGIVFDPAHPNVVWETGIRGTGGLYRTTDDGATFERLGMMTFTQLVGIDFSDPDRKTLVAGTHGMKQQLFRSTDGGSSWTNIGLNLPPTADNSESPLVIDAKTFLVGACAGDATCGIHRTTDGGATWTLSNDVKVNHFGAPLRASDGSIYWPLWADGGMSKSTDLGKTWIQITGPGKMDGVTPVELPDGTIVEVGTDHLLRSSDGGKTWTPILDPLPIKISGVGGLAYSTATKTFFVSYANCAANEVLPDSIVSSGFDYAAN
jgi:photosystem II stability/assembly factor-like uncharacterized protein